MNSDSAGASAERGNPELGDFLRARRSALKPSEAGLSGGERRRVEGLRREELAVLAGVSADYYTRLEQGRYPTASPAVLDSLARSLRLSAEERSHLHALAQAADRYPQQDGPGASDEEALRRTLGVFGRTPALLCGPFTDVVASNDAVSFLTGTDYGSLPPAERNNLLWMLTCPDARLLYGDIWEQSATQRIGAFRAESGKAPGHPRVRALVERLDRESDLFRRVWRQHDVAACHQEIVTLNHSLAGPLRFRPEAFTVDSLRGHYVLALAPADDAFEAAFQKYRADR